MLLKNSSADRADLIALLAAVRTITHAPNRVPACRPNSPAQKFRLPILLLTAAVVLGGMVLSAAAPPAFTVVESPSSAVAGSAGNILTFAFTATTQITGTATITVPASASGTPWSMPQKSSASAPGYIAVSSSSCNTAAVSSISGGVAGPWTISLNYKCASKKSFGVTYTATAATLAGAYSFVAALPEGPNTTQAVSAVNVVAGPARTLALTGLPGTDIAGTPLSATVTTYDAYGNQASGYLGTVKFTSTDSQSSLPANYAFTAADGGSHPFGVVLKTAQVSGSQYGPVTVSATDIAVASLTASEKVTVSPGPATMLSLGITNGASWGAGAFLEGEANNCPVGVYDAYSNFIYNYAVQFSSSDPKATYNNSTMDTTPTYAGTPPIGDLEFGSACNCETAGPQTITITSTTNPALTVTKSISCLGPQANPYNIAFFSPQAQGGVTLYGLNPAASARIWTNFVTVPKLVNFDQFTYTLNGATYQLGVMSQSYKLDDTPDNRLIWDLNPPAGATASVAGATLVTCTPTGPCPITTPVTASYTVADVFGNQSSNTITAQVSNPNPVPAGNNVVIGPNAFLVQIPNQTVVGLNLTLTLNTPLNIDPSTNIATVPFSSTTPCPAGTPPENQPCSFNATASLAMPGGNFSGSQSVTAVDLTQQVQVVSYTARQPQNRQFAAVTVIQQGTQVNPPTVYEAQLNNINFDGYFCVDSLGHYVQCGQTDLSAYGTAPTVGEDIGNAYVDVTTLNCTPYSQCSAPPAGYTGQLDVVTSIPQYSCGIASGYYVLAFYSNSCPTNW